jgi:hypothetical protein
LKKFLTDDQLVGYIDVDEVTKIGGGKNQEDLRIEQARKDLRNVDTVRFPSFSSYVLLSLSVSASPIPLESFLHRDDDSSGRC